MSFNHLKLNERITKAVTDTGYADPTPIQNKAIPLIIQKHDLIGIAQTGTGKTAAFVLPILSDLCARTGAGEERITRVLILAPTRELVQQICENIRTYAKYTNVRTLIVTGKSGEAHQIKGLQSGVDIVIATPGRLQDLMDKGATQFNKLEYLVLDEADRMLDMGFLPAIETIVKPLPRLRQTLLFSATLSKAVEKLANNFMTKPKMIEVGDRTSPADTVNQCVYLVDQGLKPKLLLHLLEDQDLFAVICFVRTRVKADVVTDELKSAKIPVVAIHGEKTQNHRNRAIKDFKSAKIRVLVATDVAARGLDIQGVTHVINYDFPEHNEDYIHRIGRTGRAGAAGYALTFVTQYDLEKRLSLEKHIKRTLAQKRVEGFEFTFVPSAPAGAGRKKSERAGKGAPTKSKGKAVRSGGKPGPKGPRKSVSMDREDEPRTDRRSKKSSSKRSKSMPVKASKGGKQFSAKGTSKFGPAKGGGKPQKRKGSQRRK
jgi:ATP-dependent RNA helicase RhlE